MKPPRILIMLLFMTGPALAGDQNLWACCSHQENGRYCTIDGEIACTDGKSSPPCECEIDPAKIIQDMKEGRGQVGDWLEINGAIYQVIDVDGPDGGQDKND